MWPSRRLDFFVICASVFAGTGAAAPQVGGVAAAPTVTISPGVVIGKTTTVVSASSTTATVLNYLGVPFAAIPTGTLRFLPPVPTSWAQPVTATSLPSACRQQFIGAPPLSTNLKKVFNNPNGPDPPESEDCLYLNIYTPTDASTNNRKAVLFWIYGGNFQIGSNYLNYYNGSSFSGFQDTVVVVINYRTNIFGFSNSPELPSGQRNAGLLDQRLALSWVQDNIAAFGGDPSRVTIFGESAGANSVKQLLANPPSPLPFGSAILESQGYGTGPPQSIGYDQTAANFGCATAASPLACLQQVDSVTLETYITENNVLFPPDSDDATYTFDIRPSVLSGRFAKVPILIGSNSEEAKVFVRAGTPDLSNTTLSDALMDIFDANNTLVDLLVAAYSDSTTTIADAVAAVLNDYVFTCTASRIANLIVLGNGADTWRYYYNASFPNLQYLPRIGAYHSSEIPQVFGTYPDPNALGAATPAQIALSRYMQATWADFAKAPGVGPAWPRLTANLFANQMGELGGIDPGGETTISVNGVDARCLPFDPIYAIQGL